MDKVIHTNPFVGFITAIALNIIGFISSPDNAPHIPQIIMEVGQLIAWASAFIVMCITVHGWYQRNFTAEGRTAKIVERKK